MPDLLPTSPDTSRQVYEVYAASQYPVMSVGLNQWQYGPRPMQDNQPRQAVPIPRPHHKMYSSVMTAQRKREESDMGRQMQQRRHHEDIRQQRWIRPAHQSLFQIFRPNIHNFNKPLGMRMPEHIPMTWEW